jgi:hypothetical protein
MAAVRRRGRDKEKLQQVHRGLHQSLLPHSGRLPYQLEVSPYFQPGFRIRIHFFRIRIQRLRLETNTDPDPIRIQGFNDRKLKKNYS